MGTLYRNYENNKNNKDFLFYFISDCSVFWSNISSIG